MYTSSPLRSANYGTQPEDAYIQYANTGYRRVKHIHCSYPTPMYGTLDTTRQYVRENIRSLEVIGTVQAPCCAQAPQMQIPTTQPDIHKIKVNGMDVEGSVESLRAIFA